MSIVCVSLQVLSKSNSRRTLEVRFVNDTFMTDLSHLRHKRLTTGNCFMVWTRLMVRHWLSTLQTFNALCRVHGCFCLVLFHGQPCFLRFVQSGSSRTRPGELLEFPFTSKMLCDLTIDCFTSGGLMRTTRLGEKVTSDNQSVYCTWFHNRIIRSCWINSLSAPGKSVSLRRTV